jgi:hypothetical protein
MVNTSNFGLCYGSLTVSYRDHVLPLVSGVSGARYKGFSTCEKAIAYYLDAKDNGLVNIVRDPGDDALFGPLHDAMQ